MTCRRNIPDPHRDDMTPVDPPVHPDHKENPLAFAGIWIVAIAIVALVLALVG